MTVSSLAIFVTGDLSRYREIALLVGLLILVGVGALGGWRWARALHKQRQKTDMAIRQLCSMQQLTLSSLQVDLQTPPGSQMATSLLDIFTLDAVAIFDADLHEVYQAGSWSADPGELVQNIYYFETADDDVDTGVSRRVIRLGAVPIGSVLMRGETTPPVNDAIAAILALTFDRYRATANEGRIEAERQAEQMRVAVLDNLAHAYKTPLTAIRAASSGLYEMGRLSAGQAELVSLIDEQAGVLNDLTNRLLTTERLGAGTKAAGGGSLRGDTVAVGSLLDEAIASLGDRPGSERIHIDLTRDELELFCDRRLLTMLLTQYLDNACKYSVAGTRITLRATESAAEVLFSVHSYGAVIPMADRERIFDRYYRSGPSEQRPAGTGVGLSIAKRAALAQGGSVWVSSDETEGTTFFAAIPATSQTEPHGPRSYATSEFERSSL